MSQFRYGDEQFTWLAEKLAAENQRPQPGDRDAIFKAFAEEFSLPMSRNRLAGIMGRHGPGKAAFLKKYAPDPKTRRIAAAFADWNPETAENENAYAFAAAQLNRHCRVDTHSFTGSWVEEYVARMGGIESLLRVAPAIKRNAIASIAARVRTPAKG